MPSSKEIYELIRQDILNRPALFDFIYEIYKDQEVVDLVPEWAAWRKAGPIVRSMSHDSNGEMVVEYDPPAPTSPIQYDLSTRRSKYQGPQDFIEKFKWRHDGTYKPWSRLWKRGAERGFDLKDFPEIRVVVEEQQKEIHSIKYYAVPMESRKYDSAKYCINSDAFTCEQGVYDMNPDAVVIFETKF